MPDAATRAKLEAAVAKNWEKQVAFLADLVRFPSVRGKEGPCQDWIARQFAARGWDVDRYTLSELDGTHPKWSPVMDTDYSQAVQVVATVRAQQPGGRSLILQGHVDVVPEGPVEMWQVPAYDPAIRDGWMNGRGANDMKSGVAAMIFAMDAVRDAGLTPRGDIYVQTVTEEECTGNGALSTLCRGYRADACLIPEPTGEAITRGHVGVMWFRLKLRGVPVHVMEAQKGTNAILSAFRIIEELQALTARINERARSHPVFKAVENPVKFNPGKIRGGDWASSTPAWCEVDCRIGLLPGTPLAEARAEVEAAVAAAAKSDAFLANSPPEVIWNGFQADGLYIEPDSEAERVLAAAHTQVFGAPPRVRLSTGVNDTRFYYNDFGIPSICYGAAGFGSHAFDERVDLESVKRTTLSIAAFITDWCGAAPG